MNPTHMVLVFDKNNKFVTGTIAYSKEEAYKIGENWVSEEFDVIYTEVDYSMRSE